MKRIESLVIALAIVVLLVSTGYSAEENRKWTSLDTGLQVTYTFLHITDWSQTLHASRRRSYRNQPLCYRETNPVLGDNPSTGRINSYFASTLLLHSAIAYILPKPYRTIWQSFWIGAEYSAVQQNREYGLGVSLHF